jgi:hypothetical protein
VVVSLAIVFVASMFLIVFKFPNPTPAQEFVFRLALALIAVSEPFFPADMGVKATGALGLFSGVRVHFSCGRMAKAARLYITDGAEAQAKGQHFWATHFS